MVPLLNLLNQPYHKSKYHGIKRDPHTTSELSNYTDTPTFFAYKKAYLDKLG